MELTGRIFKTVGLAAMVLMLLAVTAPAVAAPFVQFDYTSLRLYYSGAGSRELTITDTLSSTATISLKDGLTLADGPAIIIEGTVFDVALQGQVATAADGYAMTGTFTATDLFGTRFDAAFNSANVSVLPGNQGTLLIEGTLSGVGGDSILVGGGDGWQYTGSFGTSVSVADPGPYGAGELFQMTFGVNGATLADLFDDGEKDGGSGIMHGTIFTPNLPAPAAAALGMVGLGLVGLWMRKHT